MTRGHFGCTIESFSKKCSWSNIRSQKTKINYFLENIWLPYNWWLFKTNAKRGGPMTKEELFFTVRILDPRLYNTSSSFVLELKNKQWKDCNSWQIVEMAADKETRGRFMANANEKQVLSDPETITGASRAQRTDGCISLKLGDQGLTSMAEFISLSYW